MEPNEGVPKQAEEDGARADLERVKEEIEYAFDKWRRLERIRKDLWARREQELAELANYPNPGDVPFTTLARVLRACQVLEGATQDERDANAVHMHLLEKRRAMRAGLGICRYCGNETDKLYKGGQCLDCYESRE